MRHRVQIVLIILLALLAWALATGRGHACSCGMPGLPVVERDAAVAVFSGRVLRVDVRGGEVTSSADPVWVGFQTYSVWKGPALSTLVVSTARETASCGYPFEVGQEYLVYARGTWDALEVSLCSRTRTLSTAGEDLAALGPGTVLWPLDHQAARRPAVPLWMLLPAGLGAAALAALVVRSRRSQQPR